MADGARRDQVSDKMLRFLNSLDPKDRAELTEALRDPKTFIAEDLEDLLAVLKHIEAEREKAEKKSVN